MNNTNISTFQVNGVDVVSGDVVTLPPNTISVNVYVVPNDPNATYTVNGNTDLQPGGNTLTVTIMAQDGITTQDYTVTLFVEFFIPPPPPPTLSNNTNISTFQVNGVDVVSGDTVTLPPNTTSVNVVAERYDLNSTLTINGNTDLQPGNNTLTVTVVAQDGITTQNYTVTLFVRPIPVFYIPIQTYYFNHSFTITKPYIYNNDNYTFTYTIDNPKIASISGDKITILSVGTAIITATQVSNTNNDLITISAVLTVNPFPCFKKDTKILTDKGYIPIQNLKKGDRVKTLLNDFIPINMIGKREIYHEALEERVKIQLYKCSKEQYPELIEDLIITGCHSILVDEFKSDEERKKVIEINVDTFVTDRKYRLPACADDRTTVYEIPGNYMIYHIALDNIDYYMNYGIYANGLLVETSSKRYLKEISGMELYD